MGLWEPGGGRAAARGSGCHSPGELPTCVLSTGAVQSGYVLCSLCRSSAPGQEMMRQLRLNQASYPYKQLTSKSCGPAFSCPWKSVNVGSWSFGYLGLEAISARGKHESEMSLFCALNAQEFYVLMP